MLSNPLEYFPIWAHFLFSCALIGLSLQTGHVFGKFRQKRSGDSESHSIGIAVGALLSLFAFLLAFTFSAASSRYENRKEAVLEEANAIGTMYLRADLLQEKQRSEAKELLRQYVKIRLAVAKKNLADDAIDDVISRSEPFLEQLWELAVSAAESAPSPITGLFVQATNDVIDVNAKRVMSATRSTIPFEIWICLYLLAVLGLCALGFDLASNNKSFVFPTLAFVLACASVLTTIQDIDNPVSGVLRTDQYPMIDLYRSMTTGTLND